MLALSFKRGEGDYGSALCDKGVSGYLFYASGSVGFVQLVYLGDDDYVWNVHVVHIVDHHSVVLSDARAAVDKLDYAAYEIDIFVLREISVGKA